MNVSVEFQFPLTIKYQDEIRGRKRSSLSSSNDLSAAVLSNHNVTFVAFLQRLLCILCFVKVAEYFKRNRMS